MTEWKKCKLGSLCNKIGSGATPRGGSSVYLEEGEYSLIRSQNVRNNYFDSTGLTFIDPKHAAQLANVEVKDNDVLLNITGDSVARCCQVAPAVLPARVNQHVSIIRPDQSRLEPRFLRYYLVSPKMQAKMLTLASSGATRNALTKGMIEDFLIPLPPINEQKRIASILGAFDDKIELNRQMNATLEGMTQALFKSWFVDFEPVRAKAEGRRTGLPSQLSKLFPSEFEDSKLGPIPKGWKVGTVQDTCNKIQNGGTPKRNEPSYWENPIIPWLTSGEVRQSIIIATENFISDEGLKNSSAKWIAEGSTVVALYGATAGQVAFLAFPSTTNQAVCCLTPKTSYTYYNYLSVSNKVAHFERQASGSAQQNISKGIVEQLQIAIPSPAVLHEFDKYCTFIFQKRIEALKESQSLSALRDTLLPKLLSGEINVKT